MLLKVEVITFNLKDNEISLQVMYKLHLNIRYLITFSLSHSATRFYLSFREGVWNRWRRVLWSSHVAGCAHHEVLHPVITTPPQWDLYGAACR